MKRISILLAILFIGNSAFSQNWISIILNSESYDCKTGNLTVNFTIENSDINGNTNYHTVYNVQFGTSDGMGKFTGSAGSQTFEVTGRYTLGETVTISAYGISNNGAPLVTFPFDATQPPPPAAPGITLPSLPLCNGMNASLSANGNGGQYIWSDGNTGQTIFIGSAGGTWTVHESNYCGNSPESAPAVITTSITPTAPGISSSAGAVLCNGIVTTLISGASYGGYMEWATGEIGDYHNTSAAGTYYVREVNSCGAGPFSAGYVITTSSTPIAPVLNLNGTKLLCDGATQNLITSPISAGGVIHWSTGEVANGINVNAAGSYYAYEYNPLCGASPNSYIVTITTSSTPNAPAVSPAGPIILCDGNATTLSAFGPGTISWYKNGSSYGATDTYSSVNTSGSYIARCSNACGVSGNSNTVVVSTNITPPAPNLNVSGTITQCDGAGQYLSTGPVTSGGYINWSNGVTGNSQTVTAAGGYYAYETNPACGTGGNSATVNITTLSKPIAPSLTPASNQLLCNGSSTILSSSGASITWSNGATGNTLNTATAGTYYTFDRNYCGNSPNSNPVTITTATCPPPTPGTSFSICPGSQKMLDAGAGYDTYLWSNGQTTRTVNVGPGTYTVMVTKYGCSATSNAVTVSYYLVSIPTITSSGSTVICSGENVTLTSSVGTAYLWSNGNTTGSITVGNSGGYFVNVTDYNGCNTTSATTTVTVRPLPNASIAGNATLCRNANQPFVVFTGSNATAPYTFTYRINGGASQSVSIISGNTVSINVPTATDGTYIYDLLSVKESSSTTCSNAASGTATVTINPLPIATIAGTTTVCQNVSPAPVTFTASGGTAPYTISYQINGGPVQTIGTLPGNTATIGAPTNFSGTYTYSLVSVQDNSSTHCSNAASGSATVKVNPLPAATIAGNATICQNSSQPLITFTGSNATAPYTFNYSVNGGQLQTISSLGTIVTLPVPSSLAGTFTYSLVSVEESSNTHCSNTIFSSATVNINPLPTATITGTTTVCQNTLSPTITFTADGGTAPYTFRYNVNGQAKTIQTTAGNSVTIEAPTNVSGVYTYSLISLQESSSTQCTNAATGTVTITINPLPRASISGSATICQNSPAPQVTFTGSNATLPYTFFYLLNGIGVDSVTSTANAVTLPVPTTTAGNYTYSLLSIKESSSTSCTDLATGSATIKVNPLPVAQITGTAITCQNSISPVLTIKGSNATAPYTFSYSINGGSSLTTNSNDSIVQIAAPTNTPGNFNYALISVKENSSTQCSNAVSGSALITINQLANATIKGDDTVCQYTSPIPVVFTATGGVAPYTFTYRINGGANKTITTSIGNTLTIGAPTDAPGKFVYELIAVQESSSTRCINYVSSIATITVNPLPAKAALVTPVSHLCNGVSGQITVYNYTSGYTYTWYRNGELFRVTGLDTIIHSMPGKYNVLVISDKGCDAPGISDSLIITTGSISQPVITGYTRVCPGGNTTVTIIPKDSTLNYESISWKDRSNHILETKSSFSALAGEYVVNLQRQGCYDSALVLITPNDTIFPAGKLIADTNHIDFGNRVTLKAEVSNAKTYFWSFGDGTKAITTSNIVNQYFYKASDSLTVQVTAVSSRNCQMSFTTYLRVDPFDSLVVPDLSRTGKVKDWNIYPMPFHDRLKATVQLLLPEQVRIDAFTISGQWVRSWQFLGQPGENIFDFTGVASLPSNAVYLFVSIYNKEKHFSKAFKY